MLQKQIATNTYHRPGWVGVSWPIISVWYKISMLWNYTCTLIFDIAATTCTITIFKQTSLTQLPQYVPVHFYTNILQSNLPKRPSLMTGHLAWQATFLGMDDSWPPMTGHLSWQASYLDRPLFNVKILKHCLFWATTSHFFQVTIIMGPIFLNFTITMGFNLLILLY